MSVKLRTETASTDILDTRNVAGVGDAAEWLVRTVMRDFAGRPVRVTVEALKLDPQDGSEGTKA